MASAVNIVGSTYGRLTVLARLPNCHRKQSRWLCRCSCDARTEKPVAGHYLTSGKTVSCGCIKAARDLTGSIFGRWTVLRRASNCPQGTPRWICACACHPGTESTVFGHSLKNGRSRSCGCLQRELASQLHAGNTYSKGKLKLPRGDRGRSKVMCNYRSGAKSRGLEWGLTDEEFFSLTDSRCHYCGVEPSRRSEAMDSSDEARAHSLYMYNGIDRVDNLAGYTPSNCVTCCYFCNHAKAVHSYDIFVEYLDRVTAFRGGSTSVSSAA